MTGTTELAAAWFKITTSCRIHCISDYEQLSTSQFHFMIFWQRHLCACYLHCTHLQIPNRHLAPNLGFGVAHEQPRNVMVHGFDESSGWPVAWKEALNVCWKKVPSKTWTFTHTRTHTPHTHRADNVCESVWTWTLNVQLCVDEQTVAREVHNKWVCDVTK